MFKKTVTQGLWSNSRSFIFIIILMVSHYLTDIIILLIAAVIAVPIFQAIKLGAVPGFLVAGIIVGSSGLGLISNEAEIGHLSEIGVVLLLFVIGIELKPSRLWLMRRFVFGLGSLQVLLTGGILSGLSYYFFDVSLRAAILIGPALALSSTAFVLQLLTEQKALNSDYGRTAFAVLLLQDLAVVPLLALIPLLAMPELSIGKDIGLALAESLVVLSLVIGGGRYCLHPILHRVALSGNSEIFTASAVLIVLGTALVTEKIGLSMALGAFIAGLLISDSAYRHQIMAEIQPFRGLLLGLFFMSMGMSLNLNYFLDNPYSSLMIVSILILIKVCVLWLLATFFELKNKTSLAVGLILGQSGEFAMVLFALAYDANLLKEDVFQQLLLVVLLSMLITPALAYFAQSILKIKGKTKPQIEQAETVCDSPIVIAGFGRVGRRIGDIFTTANQTFVALDSSPELVERERAKGYPVFFGDVRQPEVLKAAGASKAALIVITINDMKASEEVVASLRHIYPKTNIYVRGHSLSSCRQLKKLGATVAVSENVEASLELARVSLAKVGIKEKEQEFILSNFRRAYYAQINDDEENAL